jgi:predicted GNAT superfamily acetyltransferase
MNFLRDATEPDFAQIVKLNEAVVQFTSPMNLGQFRSLFGMSAYCKVAEADGEVAAFLLVFKEGAEYESENYQWFASRHPQFLYVDRIVVGHKFAGQGIGAKLYLDLFEFARSHSVDTITCEYNIEPPNLVSRDFHDKFGFEEVGTQFVAGGSKKVSLQSART